MGESDNMKKFCFIILHYSQKSIEDTYECIDSIMKRFDSSFYQAVVVENGSQDKSFEKLKERYGKFEQITLLYSKDNLGFAKGNNLASTYALEHFQPQFMIFLNNDTLVIQDDFLELIEREYNTNEFHILGPDIIDSYNIHQNPIQSKVLETLEDIDAEIEKTNQILKSIETYGKCKKLLFKLSDILRKSRILSCLWKKTRSKNLINKYYEIPQWDKPLHGSAIVFSQKYFQLFDEWIFYPETFLYVEEDILFYISKRYNLDIRYQPNIIISHKEDSSTNSIVDNRIEKIKFINNHKLKSLNKFRDLLLNDSLEHN